MDSGPYAVAGYGTGGVELPVLVLLCQLFNDAALSIYETRLIQYVLIWRGKFKLNINK
jgi:hypothetical protein